MKPLHYLPIMFATCMQFMVIYLLCVLLWGFFPEMKGHVILPAIFPEFKLLDTPSFFYGLIMSGMYGWLVAIVFVFFYNLWPKLARLVLGNA